MTTEQEEHLRELEAMRDFLAAYVYKPSGQTLENELIGDSAIKQLKALRAAIRVCKEAWESK